MFQTFETTADPTQGAERLTRLRGEMRAEGLDGFFVPRADAYQGEYVAECDARLAWLTGFTGSAGFCIALADEAGVFVDGRYRAQVRGQVDLDAYTPVDWPEIKPGPWLAERLSSGAKVGFDPWLHTAGEIATIETALKRSGIEMVACDNLVDRIWSDRPAPPAEPVVDHPVDLAGQTTAAKLDALVERLRDAGQSAAILTAPDSICWLLNIRGNDIPRVPVMQGVAIVTDAGKCLVFATPRDFSAVAPGGDTIAFADVADFAEALSELTGPVRVDKATAPIAVSRILEDEGIEVEWGQDPCALPKARKNEAEVAGSRAAHLRDAAALVEFLTWYDATVTQGGITEIDLVTELESQRRATNALRDISFETIAGSGPNGAIMHYRVTRETNRTLVDGDLVVLDSGGQYADGTTDITRTLPVGDAGDEERAAFTRVLKGMIAISRARFPTGVAGAHLDALARYPLWLAHQDFNHGTGHGVGSYLSVHEGPQRLSRLSDVPLEPGMILSNEPGYYRDGAFGIRIENLIVVTEAVRPATGDDRAFLAFETLTFVPIDRRLILTDMLDPGERDWLNSYHRSCLEKLSGRVSAPAHLWLTRACAPL
ncbi:aminopeptidase P family protein [Maritimibacter sp. UBA3975]|uniref:aminopeptidase P family protein n=1 Tax=Maritimibacter sp. UBA3975 TaxID=1946833 RepID=UPI000C0ABC6E|nr:aminopeptidase P family protein [Maritimibacter sp. UBA3975]MAM61637.1 X-Pro aminopeptidase [Maritimibacter sp.]|tara:strand:+ start:17033 stop:18832 length:1800 start_codon:yes stop_codon:yes gene_type:complete